MRHAQFRSKTACLKNALAAGASLAALGSAGAAMAQVQQPSAPLQLRTDYLGYSASASARVGYSDNINLQRDELADSELFLSTLLTGGAVVSTPRVTALFLGDLDLSYLTDQSDFVVNQDIAGTSTFTALDNWLYVDLSGSTTRQLVGDNARFSGSINSARGQRANVHSYSASPYVYRRFADLSSAEVRYRFTQVFVDDSNQALNPFGGGAFNDSRSNEVLASYESGGLLNRARFRVTAYGNDTSEDTPEVVFDDGSGPQMLSDFEYRQGSVTGDAQFSINQSFALSGAIGYDEVETDGLAELFFDDDELSGFFWRAGFSASPGRRSSIRLEYGERYGDDFINANINYRLSQRFVFTASANRSFRTRAQSVSSQFRTTSRAALDFADQLREGQELSPRGVVDAANFFAGSLSGAGAVQTTGVAVADSASAFLRGGFGRTDLSVGGFYADENFGFRQVETYGARFEARRRLSRRLTAYGNVDYRRADTTVDLATCEANPVVFGFDTTDPLFDAATQCANLTLNNGVTNTVIARAGGAYRLFEDASVFIEGAHTERFSPNDLLEYSENSILAGITLDF